jgi:hypothetical protein
MNSSPEAPPAVVSQRHTSQRKRSLLRLVQVLLVVAVLYFLASYLHRSWLSVSGYEWTLQPGWLALSAMAFLGFYATQALAWWFLLRGFALRSPLAPTFSIWAKSILARYLPGNVFMFAGRAWMCHAQGLPVDRVSAAMVYEQALGVASALLTLAVLFPFWEYRPSLSATGIIGVPVLVALLHPRVFAPLSARLLRLLHREPLEAVLRFGTVLALLAFYVGAWLLAGAGAWSLARGTVGLSVSTLPLVTIAYALAYVAGMVAFVFPSGVGVREGVLTASLAARLPAGVALAWALLLRLWVTAVELVFIGVVVAVEIVLRRRSSR